MAIEPQQLELIQHVTGKGKVLNGYAITSVGEAEVFAVDPYTFKKAGGWFVREKHLQALLDAGIGTLTPAPSSLLPQPPPPPTAPIDNAKQIVETLAAEMNAKLSPWVPAGPGVVGEWFYADMAIHESEISLGVSGGGVVSIKGHPFTPGDVLNTTLEATRESLIAAIPTIDQRISSLFRTGQFHRAHALWQSASPANNVALADFVKNTQEAERSPIWWLPSSTVQDWSPSEYMAAVAALPSIRHSALQALRYGSDEDIVIARSFEFDNDAFAHIYELEDMSPAIRASYDDFAARMDVAEIRHNNLSQSKAALLAGYRSADPIMPAWMQPLPDDVRESWDIGHKARLAGDGIDRDVKLLILSAELNRMGYVGGVDFPSLEFSLERDGLDALPSHPGGVGFEISAQEFFDQSITTLTSTAESLFERAYVVRHIDLIAKDPEQVKAHQGAIDLIYSHQTMHALQQLEEIGYSVDYMAVGHPTQPAAWLDNQSVRIRVADDQSSLLLNFNKGSDVPFKMASSGSGLFASISGRLAALQGLDSLPPQDMPRYYMTLAETTTQAAQSSIAAFMLGRAHPVPRLESLLMYDEQASAAAAAINPEDMSSFKYGRAFDLLKSMDSLDGILPYGLSRQYNNLVADYLTVAGVPTEHSEDGTLLSSLNQLTIEVPTHNFFATGIHEPSRSAERIFPGIIYRLSTPPRFEPGRYPWQMPVEEFKAVCNKAMGDAVGIISDELRNSLYMNFASSAFFSAKEDAMESPSREIFLQQFINPITEVDNFASDIIREIEIKKGLDGAWLVVDAKLPPGADKEEILRNPGVTIFSGAKEEAILFYNAFRRTEAPSLTESAVARESLEAFTRTANPVITERPATKASDKYEIQDFGGHIAGARKELAAAYGKILHDASTFDVSSVPLSKSWPEPNYQGLIDEGIDSYVVGWVRAAREEVPTKPRGWRLRSWTSDVTKMRGVSEKLINGTISKEKLLELMGSKEFENTKNSVGFRAEIYAEIGHEISLAGLRAANGSYSVYEGVRYSPPKTIWSAEKPGASTAFGNFPKQLATGDTRDAMLKALVESLLDLKANGASLDEKKNKRKAPRDGFNVYSQVGTEGCFVSKKIGKSHPRLKHFQNSSEAYNWMLEPENMVELNRLYEAHKEIPNERRLENEDRIGVDHRCGANVTPERFMATFGFYGVQFGNYVEGQRRQDDLNNAFDALMDLSTALKLPPKALSLNGTLGLAFGARGSGGKNAPMATFSPSHIVINLTKRKGAGSLAHEWWHGVDNYFSRMSGVNLGFLTDSKSISKSIQDCGDEKYSPTEVRNTILKLTKDIVDVIKSTDMPARSKVLDERRSSPYWNTTIELTARAFEAFIVKELAEHGGTNDYLSNIVTEGDYSLESGYPYPLLSEMEKIAPAFKGFFAGVQTISVGDKVAMFSRSELDASDENPPTANELASMVSAVSKALHWGADVQVGIVETWSDLPRTLKDQIITKRAFNLSGAYHNDKIWLVQENIQNMDHALHTILHEGCHKGLEMLLGNKSDSLMIEIYKSNPRIKGMADNLLNKHSDLSTAKATEECLADIAANQEWKSTPLHRQIIALARDAIRSVVDYLPKSISSRLSLDKWTDGDVAQLADKAILSLQTSNALIRIGVQPGTAAMYSRDYDGNRPSAQQISSPHWALVKDGRILTSGNSTGMTADYLAILAKGNAADGVLLSDKSLSPGSTYAEDTHALIFGRTWAEITAIQQKSLSPLSQPIRAVAASEIKNVLGVAELETHEIRKLIADVDAASAERKFTASGPSM